MCFMDLLHVDIHSHINEAHMRQWCLIKLFHQFEKQFFNPTFQLHFGNLHRDDYQSVIEIEDYQSVIEIEDYQSVIEVYQSVIEIEDYQSII